jgi:hypothetical protein
MQTERHVLLFRNGRNQAVRIPRVFEIFAMVPLLLYLYSIHSCKPYLDLSRSRFYIAILTAKCIQRFIKES